jgi:REP element-mobilizing transposase RayT
MPDHVHLFCTPGKLDRRGIKEWAAFWKRRVGEHRTALEGKFQWDCWDTQMRSMGHYCRKLEYVRQNPVRAGLVPRSEDWPYQGRMKDIWW